MWQPRAMALAVRVVYCGACGYKSKYLQLKKKLEDEFPGRLDIVSLGMGRKTCAQPLCRSVRPGWHCRGVSAARELPRPPGSLKCW
uniref:Selenoprotein W n=1 Tax=Homo sapiens TaxID=9606 RepID=M0QYX1_HUMAN